MSASSDKIARLYQAGDETQIVPLLQLVFNGWPKKDLPCTPEDHWRWLYVDCPEKINATVVAESGGVIVGALHSLFLRVKIGDGVVLGRKGTDAAVHPDARGSGLFSGMMEIRGKIEAANGTSIGIGQSRNPIVIGKHAQSSRYQKFPHRICIFVRIRDIDLHLKNTQDRTDHLVKPLIAPGYNALNLANRVMNVLKPKSGDGGGFTVKRVERFDEGINAFWADIKDGYDFIVEKSVNYLNWRYCDARGGNYEVWVAEEGGRIVGYEVLRVNRYNEKYPSGYIMEVIGAPGRLDVVDDLVGRAAKYFDDRGVNVVYATCVKGNSYEEVLDRYGFLDSREEAHVGVIPHGSDPNVDRFLASDPNRVHYQYGESDTI